MTAPKETEWARRQRRNAERAAHVAAHGPACQICGNVPKRGLDQDHDHRTGKTRGWLCHRCNRALPSWVTAEWLRLAADYLDPPEPTRTFAEALELVDRAASAAELAAPAGAAWREAVRRKAGGYL